MDLLRTVFNHLVLPPQVPGKEDPDMEAVSHDVLTRTIRACETVGELAGPPWSEAFQCLRSSLDICLALNGARRLDKSTMLERFRKLEPCQMLILYVTQQNAAVLVRRESDGQDRVLFESFETSATSEAVLAADQALQWDFPGRSAQLPFAEFANGSFQESLSAFLEQASMESLYSVQAHALKANISVTEVRDTTDPALITQMLMSLLEAMGSYFQAPVLRKRVRDEVNFQNAEMPWRRLPLWLVVRVAAQRQLSLTLGNERGRAAYKFLVCVLLAELLKESAGKLGPDLTITLRAKLCRRMAKLEMDRKQVTVGNADAFEHLFRQIGPKIRSAIEAASTQVEAAWKYYKQTTTRRIPRLPERAPDGAIHLSLLNSGKYLDGLLSSCPSRQEGSMSLALPEPLDKAIRQSQDFTDRVFQLAAMEMRVDRQKELQPGVVSHHPTVCLELKKQIDEVFDKAEKDSGPEQMSAMILALFTLWVRLDKVAVAACPLLGDHRPAFAPELLDVLQLPTLSGMRRLQDIQTYLAQRQVGCRHGTIFDEINENCLAVRYAGQSYTMQSLGSRIQRASDQDQDSKEAKWRSACNEYDKHTESISAGICCCSWTNGQRDVRGCSKCWHWRVRSRISIKVHEAFLPEKDPARDAVLFELAIPEYLSAYRDATWRVLSTLAYPSRPTSSSSPEIELTNSTQLQPYIEARAQNISLASKVKSFGQTHYKFNHGKVPFSRVVVPFAADFELYDRTSGLWIKDFNKPLTFQHLCGVQVPRALQATILPSSQHPPPDVDGPSSYEILANQTECPSNMSVYEFSGCQKLLAGKNRRWLDIIVEMGSSNLTFSNEDTTRLMCELAVQAGPQLPDEVLRAAHVVFKEQAFLQRLSGMIDKHLNAILTNWREHNCMELLITLSLRLFYLSTGDAKLRAETLLKTARDATLDWTVRLRQEIQTSIGPDAAERAATYGLYAALLCRRTFAIYAELDEDMKIDDFIPWVQASVALRENVLVDISRLPHVLQRMLFRDAKMAYLIQSVLRKAVGAHPTAVNIGITNSWSDSQGGITTLFAPWSLLAKPHNRWIVTTTSAGQGNLGFSQTVHYNIIEGHLLVNGQPRGKLPLEIRDDPAVKDIFSNRHILTYPSSMPGMTHRLVGRVEGQEVHFGLRAEQVIIRSWSSNGLLEFVPRQVFSSPNGFDLPAELVENCTHWLNLSTKCLEVRRAPRIWFSRPRDWSVHVPDRMASRGNVKLVDPQARVFAEIMEIFRNFERPEKLTVYQPQKGTLSVELRHMELSFYVNRNGRLVCRQLEAEIDSDQDAGTWYGLQSKILMRDPISGERSIILPLGEMTFRRRGIHVEVRVVSAPREYGSYKINEDLGQLSCPPEPRLLYTKALCHAATSFCLPDPLTRRTGTEEAFLILQSGAAQPWVPVGGHIKPILKSINSLLPRRVYYPPQIKRLQTVTWDKNLTATIQHDGYEALIQGITVKSDRLNKFSPVAIARFDFEELTHLRRRGEMHRRLYERPWLEGIGHEPIHSIYVPRDRRATQKAAYVYEIVRLIRTRCSSFYMASTLRSIFDSWEVISGFHFDDDDNNNFLPKGDPLISQIEEPINERWGDLVNFCRHVEDPAPLLFRLGLLAFGPDPDMDTIRSLVAFASIDELKNVKTPSCSSFVNFASRGRPSVQLLQELIVVAYHPFKSRRVRARRTPLDSAGRDAQGHQDLCEEEGRRLAHHLLDQWPISADMLSTDGFETEVIDVFMALDRIRQEWTRRRENDALERFIRRVQTVLNRRNGIRDTSAPLDWKGEQPVFIGRKYRSVIPSLPQELVAKEGPPGGDRVASVPFEEAMSKEVLGKTPEPPVQELPAEILELENILDRFSSSTDPLRQQYGGDLLESLCALKNVNQSSQLAAEFEAPALEAVTRDVEQARSTATLKLEQICTALSANDRRSVWLQLGDIWPCKTPSAVLALLMISTSQEFGIRMKESLVSYGLAVTSVQRLERIRKALLRNDKRVLGEELLNSGHGNWSPLQHPEWLLLEIDGNFLIRQEQADVARAILAPPSEGNSVLQMNMGKGECAAGLAFSALRRRICAKLIVGKTSCIVPMVISVLADGKNLPRLIVPKALLMQTAQTAQARLGGLIGCEIRHVPFSRKTPTTAAMLELYAELHQDIRTRRGLILTSHEHLLSYKLGGWQHLADGKLEAASKMVCFENWLTDHCRDVLDECDYTLSVKTQLNYPGGSEMAVDGHPFRWLVSEGLLALAAHHVLTLRDRLPGSVEVLERPGSFPMMHFLTRDAEDALHTFILDDICAGRTPFLRPADSGLPSRKETIARALSEKRFDSTLFAQAVSAFANPQSASKMLLVVRGLLVNRILLLCLNKRWNVQFGLHPGRHPIAVPFDAKGTPSEQSEYGHPDVAILLTCLAFYYTGLNPTQFRQGLQHVLRSDDPAAQYERWTAGCGGLPEALRRWNVVNTEDGVQLEQLWKHLRLDRTIIDYYMNHFVFPAHARQFDIKLQASAWDIPILPQGAQHGARTTGFSGTNDNRRMLPMTIQQDDLPSLRQTSADVLSYLLQPRNRGYWVTVDHQGKRLTEAGLLKQLHNQGVRVLIDAGAFILEMDNESLVKTWLGIDNKAKAAVYFGSDNRAWVHFRGETKNDLPLLATPFAENLDECVVYLDEAHTRGIDLKLPVHAHGALTLAPKQTKDYTVQAAMRLRQLRTTQSITFFAPPEVDQSIKDFCRTAKGEKLDSSHVISWLLEQTCRANDDLQSLYVALGIDFCRRTDAAWRHHDFLIDATHREKLLGVLRKPERQTLEQLYGGASPESSPCFVGPMCTSRLQAFADQLIPSGSKHDDILTGALEEVEQEREVQAQVEQVRQVQKPPRYEPMLFPGLHQTISKFARTGVLDNTVSEPSGPGFEHAFAWVAKTSIGKQFGVRETGSRLFVSKEFCKSVRFGRKKEAVDNFLRPVEWILWSPSTQTALVIIPEEVELLLPSLRRNAIEDSTAYLIAYATPVTRGMLCFNDFHYYTLPPLPTKHRFPAWFRIELGILAGRLYVDSSECESLARYLGPLSEVAECTSTTIRSDMTKELATFRLANDPAAFLLEWLTLRRKAQDVLHTPIGYICMGRNLGEKHPPRDTTFCNG